MSTFDDNNPFASPRETNEWQTGGDYGGLPGRGLVGQVRVLAVLMIVQGVLEIVMGLIYAGYIVLWVTMMQELIEQQQAQQPEGAPGVEVMLPIIIGVSLAFMVAGVVPGALRVYAGFRSYQFKSRTLALASHVLGFLPICTVYCAPTAIALSVYGLIVHLNPSVRQACAWADGGLSADDILDRVEQIPRR